MNRIRSLVIGLGNPGSKYSRTRHNVGFETIELLATRIGIALKASRDRALTAEVNASGKHFLIATPTTFMNESGNAVGPLARRFSITDPLKIIIVHDELDLEPGVVKIKSGGGLAGHNGLQSIKQHLKTQDFIRVRIGVGKPAVGAKRAVLPHDVGHRPGDPSAPGIADSAALELQQPLGHCPAAVEWTNEVGLGHDHIPEEHFAEC